MLGQTLIGLIFVAAGAGLLALQEDRAGDIPAGLFQAAWIVMRVSAVILLVGLAVIGVLWMMYLRRKDELDARGAATTAAIQEKINRRQDG